MVRLAITGNPSFVLDRRELERGGLSYTVDTLRELKKARGGARISLLVGTDSLSALPTWREPGQILEMADVIAYPRASTMSTHHSAQIQTGRTHVSDAPHIDISSTMIRDRLGRGESVRYLLPQAVADYIRDNRLYSG
jgi:nicotinate-nucleotide adenylyltransferase